MPRYEITGPDGARYEVEAPEGATEQDVLSFAQEQMGQSSEAEPGQSYSAGLVDSFTQGASFGFGDELTAAESALLGRTPDGSWFDYSQPIGERYDRALEAERGQQQAFREESPVASAVAEVAGAVPTALLPLGALGRAAQGASLPARVVAGSAIGAGQGGVYGFGSGEGGLDARLDAAVVGGGVGGALGAAAPAVGGAVRGVAQSRAGRRAVKEIADHAPDTSQLRMMAGRAYDRAKQAGATFKPEPVQRMIRSLASDMTEEGFHPRLHPKVAVAMDELAKAADDPATAPAFTTLRRFASNAAGSADPDERRIGSMLVQRLDDFMTDLTPDQVASGNATNIARDLGEARDLWSRMRKSEMVDTAFEKAGDQASGIENGLRIQFRQILNNPRKRRGLTEDEIAAMRKVVQGDFPTNTLRRLGRLMSLGSGQQTNTLSGLLTGGGAAGAGFAVGGPAGAAAGLAVPALGYGAQRGAQALTTNQGRLARALMATGGTMPTASVPASRGRLAELLVQRNVPLSQMLAAELY